MRILLVTEDVPGPKIGGAGQHAVVLGNALIEAGHEVHLLGNSDAQESANANGFQGPLHRRIDFRGARWREASTGAFMPPSRPHMARRLWQAICSLPGPWDVVHYHGHNPLLGTLVPASWNYVHSLHDQGAECIIKTRFRKGAPCAERNAHACAGCAAVRPNSLQSWLSTQAVLQLRAGSLSAFRRHKVLFVSEFLRQNYLATMGEAARDIRSYVVHNFVDAGRLTAARAVAPVSGIRDSRLQVFAAGRLDAAKGFAEWLNSIPDSSLARLRIRVAGDGPDLEMLRRQHAPRGIEILGWCQSEMVLQLTAACSVYVVPSLWDEPCATTVLEALALGRSVFALRRGGTPELARYGQLGQLRLFENMADLVDALATQDRVEWPVKATATIKARLKDVVAVYAASVNHAVCEGVAA